MSTRSVDGYRLEWLTSFLAVVDFGGFAAGAEATYRSQPRVSAHVAQLERHLGVVLIDRHERPVRLTEAGIAFLEHARAVSRSGGRQVRVASGGKRFVRTVSSRVGVQNDVSVIAGIRKTSTRASGAGRSGGERDAM